MNRLSLYIGLFLMLFVAFGSKINAEDPNIKSDKPQSLNPSSKIEKPKLISDEQLDKYLREKNIGRPEPVRGETNYWKEFTQMMMVLGGILIFLITAGWFLKRMLRVRMSHMNFSSSIKILDKRALHPKACIYYIEVDGKRFVIGEGQNNLAVLSEIPTKEGEETTDELSLQQEKGIKFASFLKSCVTKKVGV